VSESVRPDVGKEETACAIFASSLLRQRHSFSPLFVTPEKENKSARGDQFFKPLTIYSRIKHAPKPFANKKTSFFGKIPVNLLYAFRRIKVRSNRSGSGIYFRGARKPVVGPALSASTHQTANWRKSPGMGEILVLDLHFSTRGSGKLFGKFRCSAPFHLYRVVTCNNDAAGRSFISIPQVLTQPLFMR
jgi:hypothetical protein